MRRVSAEVKFVFITLLGVYAGVNCSSGGSDHFRKLAQSATIETSISAESLTPASAALDDDTLQIEAEGYFDVVEQPEEQFISAVAATNETSAPIVKGSAIFDDDDWLQSSRLDVFAPANNNNDDTDDDNDNDDASGNSKKCARKNSPLFLLNTDLTKIQSDTKNIENDSGNHFFYENNILAKTGTTLRPIKVTTKKSQRHKNKSEQPLRKENDFESISKKFQQKKKGKKYNKNYRQISFEKRLFLQLKSKRFQHTRKYRRKIFKNRSRKMFKERASLVSRDSLTPIRNEEPSNDLLNRDRRAVTAQKKRIWDHGVIPYDIDHIFSSTHKALFKQAMRHWENFTCIKFVEREPKVHPNYIYFTVRPCGCCSYVGKRGDGRQSISIGKNCDKFGIVVHELGHVIGFWHEHTRSDRDQHIVINKENIMKGQENNFNVLSPQDVDSLGQPYDYNSIMHYSKNTFSKNVYLDTIRPIGVPEHEHIEIGQRLRLSPGDIAQANLLYKCAACGRTFQENSGQIVAPHYFYYSKGIDEDELIYQNDEDVGSGDGGQDVAIDVGANEDLADKSIEICEWRITATNGERIILEIHHLNLLPSKDCQKDYLEIRDGYWFKSPVIRRICGNATSLTIKSDSSRMLINYVNRNARLGYRGFMAEFEVMCGGDIFLTDKRRIDSPNYPLEYMPDKECVWRITVPEKHQVAIEFQSFELENHDNCIYDYVEIRDGDQSNSELIGMFCGKKLPLPIKTNTNQMYLKFVSDGSVQKVGFSAIFMKEVDECKYGNHGCQHECVNTLGSFRCRCFTGYELESDGKSCKDACGGIIDATTRHRTLNSPSYPDVYPISKRCIWELVAPPNFAVFLNFTHFDLEGSNFQYNECNYDYLIVYSKLADSRLKKIGTFCGNEIPPLINSEQNILRIEFSSDKSVQQTGFFAHFEIDIDECSKNNGGCQHYCRNTLGSYDCSCRNGYTLHANRHNCTETNCKFELTNSYGVISSPNYPNNYPRSTYCFWHFQTVLGHRVQLTFNDFEVEKHQECIYDYVAIYDGKSENSSSLGTYCGGRVPYTVQASTNQMFMVLKTDAGLQHKGFLATYSTECGGYLRATNRSQVFYSHPRYGRRPYKRNMYCNWRIQADSDSSVKIKFLHFEIEYSERCDFDYVEITEELSPRNKNHGTYCGNRRPPNIVSYSDMLMLRFQTDRSTSLKGFVVSFVAVEPPDEDDNDDIDVTPFPGYMKNVYYASDTSSDYEENSGRHRHRYQHAFV